jgi:NAD+ synthase (glutamine-hydrolysing)
MLHMRVALAQLNPIVGDIAGNLRLVMEAIDVARADGAELVVFSEMVLLGYPPRDLILRGGVAEACEEAARQAAAHAGDIAIVLGHPRYINCVKSNRPYANSLSACEGGRVVKVYDKRLLPGYDVFDEDRYFEPGRECGVVELAGRRVGLLICEDLWRAGDVNFVRRYDADPVAELAERRCDLVVALNASPFVAGKWVRHLKQLRESAIALGCPVVSVNQVGGNDDLIFDGRSVAMDATGEVRALLPGWEPAVEVVELHRGEKGNGARGGAGKPIATREPDINEELFHALVLGVRDYVHKTGNTSVALGLSGGIDSALVATLAVAALGAAHVTGMTMPSRYSSQGSVTDAVQVAMNLGMARLINVSIESLHGAAAQAMHNALDGELSGVADENTQARLRGIILMAYSNTTGALLLATGNKSELATGYCTLYGDMCGALCVLGDVVKTRIYTLARWINVNYASLGFKIAPIPEASIMKPPSAELKANQTDQDTLPAYDVLDQIITRLVEDEQSADEIVAETGLDAALVNRWVGTIDQQEYKREQAALVLKVTPRAFGRGRPMPMAVRETAPAASDRLRSKSGEGEQHEALKRQV